MFQLGMKCCAKLHGMWGAVTGLLAVATLAEHARTMAKMPRVTETPPRQCAWSCDPIEHQVLEAHVAIQDALPPCFRLFPPQAEYTPCKPAWTQCFLLFRTEKNEIGEVALTWVLASTRLKNARRLKAFYECM